MRLNTKSVAFKIVLYATLCVMTVGIFSNLYLYLYLQKKIVEKADAIDTLYLSTVTQQLDLRLASAFDLGVICANDTQVMQAMRLPDMRTYFRADLCLKAQEMLNSYRRSSNIINYIDKLVILNQQILVQGQTSQVGGLLSDHQAILHSPLVAQGRLGRFTYTSSVTPFAGNVLALLLPIGGSVTGGYLYLELNPAIITDVLLPYSGDNTIFVGGGGAVIAPRPVPILPEQLEDAASAGTLRTGDTLYRVSVKPLGIPGFSVYNCIDTASLSLDNQKMSYTLVVVVVSVLCVTVGILVIMSHFITRPVKRLVNRIQKIAENDFSYDPTIEESQDEMGEIGRVVNEMMMSINNLLRETEEMHEQRKNIEIALLQSQVNPHFLYNTLDSIHWMAVIHKNPGIQSITRALSNLLRSIAKGTQDKITLGEEIALLTDYVAIQSIRYMETFKFVCKVPQPLLRWRIVKLTLQPLVENAIFHGIEPTGEFGTITLDGREDGDDLLLWVEDDGIGIEPEKLAELLTGAAHKVKGAMNGIGVANVHMRLQLLYGSRYGLTVDSVHGEFTRVTVRIPKEE